MLSREVQNAFANQRQVIGVFFDLEKAYDATWRGGILKQLASWGIGGNMFCFVKNFFIRWVPESTSGVGIFLSLLARRRGASR